MAPLDLTDLGDDERSSGGQTPPGQPGTRRPRRADAPGEPRGDEHRVRLGLRADAAAGLAPSTLARLDRLDRAAGHDLVTAAVAARRRAALAEDPAVLARELARFLALHVVTGDLDRALVPVPAVDEVWHELILDTVRYRELCDEVFGAFLDHVPTRDGALDPQLARAAAEDTTGLLTWCFGPPDPVWDALRASG